ncbi:MAG: tetratricopeptide repeat protein, partial [Planctomycetales bacterium]
MKESIRNACCGITVFALAASWCFAQHDYKVSRRLIRAGQHEKAIETLNARVKKFPDDSEWVYQLALAHAQAGNLDQAETALKQALAMGVPPGRAAADSHEWLKPLRDSKTMANLLQEQLRLPIQGPMLGDVTAHGAKIWLRTAGPTTATVRV